MKIFDVKDPASNTSILLMLTGVLIVPSINYLINIIAKVIGLIIYFFNGSFGMTSLIVSYVFEVLIMVILGYLITITLMNSKKTKR